jgi:hypothetical protein
MKSKFFFTLMALLIVRCSISLAQVPQLINYQGKLTNPSGAPVNDTLQMFFTIYADSGGTIPLWVETQPTVEILKGAFNVLLGSFNPIPYPVFDGGTRYLGVKVGGDLEITPRKPMVSVAYAYRAGAASDNDWVFPQSAGGTNPRPYLYTYGSWGIARYGNALFGNADSTHVNLGVACTTGTSGQNYKYCTVGGGMGNTASGYAAAVGGGGLNTASHLYATVGGGGLNTASGDYATVGGGGEDTASGIFATVGGGGENTASGDYATVGGGDKNFASEAEATVGGGGVNSASGSAATVGGGEANAASGMAATVGGGIKDTASGSFATVGGGENNTASGDYPTVGGGMGGVASGYGVTVGGGIFNTASHPYATVGGGGLNSASGDYAIVGGGSEDTASGNSATVGGGGNNIASGDYATMGGGRENTASGFGATVGGGDANSASGNDATVGGGLSNSNSGAHSAVPGGAYDTLTVLAGNCMAFGYMVYVNNSFEVVFFEGVNSGRLGINRDDHDGGISYPIHVGTNTSNGNGAYLTDGGVWTNGSSRTFKEKFQPLNSQEFLEKISDLPVEAWNFKNSDERHIGPVAEDFVSAFDVGTVREDGTRDNKYLATEDIAGVALAGVKELIKENQELKQTIEKLSQKIAQLERTK